LIANFEGIVINPGGLYLECYSFEAQPQHLNGKRGARL